MRVLGLAADGAFAVLETDGRTIEAFGRAGTGDFPTTDIDLIGLETGDAGALARQHGLPVACDFAAAGPAVYYRARARASGLERPIAVVDASAVTLIAENGLLTVGGGVEGARTIVHCDSGSHSSKGLSAAEVGWRVEALRAEAIAFLAARVWNGFPIAFPGTTGAPYPMTGGRIVRP